MYKHEIDCFINTHKEDMIELLKSLVAMPSVKAPAKKDMPYGENIDRILKFVRKTADNMGFITDCFENKIDIADINGKPAKLGIMCHLDVVDVNKNAWSTDPFNAVIKDNKIYGRGVLDNKGPAAAALYAAYAVKSLGIPLKSNARLYFGSDEESGSNEFRSYLKNNALPEYVFVPDACFPVGVSEKGRIVLHGKENVKSDKILSAHGGNAENIVPETACAEIVGVGEKEINSILDEIPDINYETKSENGITKITIIGKSSHSANPQWGVNAVTAMLFLINKIEPDNRVFAELSDRFAHGVFFGEKFGIDAGSLTLSMNMFSYENGLLKFTTDSRVSVGKNSAQLAKCIADKLTINVTADMIEEPHVVSADSDIVKTLQKIYKNQTQRDDEPYDMDAFTYSHLKDNAVIFGGVLYGDGSENAHGSDECYNLDTLVTAAKMFAQAIVEICKTEE